MTSTEAIEAEAVSWPRRSSAVITLMPGGRAGPRRLAALVLHPPLGGQTQRLHPPRTTVIGDTSGRQDTVGMSRRDGLDVGPASRGACGDGRLSISASASA